MLFNSKTHRRYLCAFLLFVLFLFIPVFVKQCFCSTDSTFLDALRSFMIGAAIVSTILLIRNKPTCIILLSIFAITTLTELVMVLTYGCYMGRDHFLAFVTTTPEECSAFASNNLIALAYLIPLLFVFVGICILLCHSSIPALKLRLTNFGLCAALMIVSLLPYDHREDFTNFQAYKVDLFFSVLSVPPMNMFHHAKVAIRQTKRIHEANDFVFNSTRRPIKGKETYVLAIGESVRYSNFGLYGQYQRNTTPLLGQQSNIIAFDDYYTGGCSTAISIPIIITRATTQDETPSYTEKSIIQPFKENGFTTVVIKQGLFMQPSAEYLYQNVDYAVEAYTDADVITAIDSISQAHEKTFIMFQFHGSHFYFENCPKAFRYWNPNSLSEPQNKSEESYINSYDNSILYTDYLLNNLIDTLKNRGTSALWYISDHGETISESHCWHGLICDSNEYHVPCLFWYSDAYQQTFSDKVATLSAHTHSPINAENIFYTICGQTDIVLPEAYSHNDWDISSPLFQPHPRYLKANGTLKELD